MEHVKASNGKNATKTYSSSSDSYQNIILPAGYQYVNNSLKENPFISFVDYSPFQNLLYGDELQ